MKQIRLSIKINYYTNQHCCPSGYTCDVKDGRCNKAGVSFPFQKKIASTKKVQPVKDVVCPGGKSDCPADTTCCALADGEYGWYNHLKINIVS
jgi:hypothetical protein